MIKHCLSTGDLGIHPETLRERVRQAEDKHQDPVNQMTKPLTNPVSFETRGWRSPVSKNRAVHLQPSPLEVLLPDGIAQRIVVLGSANTPAPICGTTNADEDTLADLVLINPSREERRDRRWIASTSATVAGQLARDGIAYVLAPTALRLRRALYTVGLREEGCFLHLPDVARSRYLVPVGSAAERYAFSGPLPMSEHKRVAALAALRVPMLARLGPSGVAFRRPGARPLARWLFELHGKPPPPWSALVSRSWRNTGATVLLRFTSGESKPDLVVKLSPTAPAELSALQEIAPAAGRSGARVPIGLLLAALESRPFVAQTPVGGRPAQLLLGRGLVTKETMLERIAAWLLRWGAESAQRREITRADVEARVLGPAREVARVAPVPGYVDYLVRLSAKLVGLPMPFVAAHNDMTTSNILVLDEDPRLGIVDWEDARAEWLPLTDFFYASADVAASVGDTDGNGRVRAFVECFTPEGAAHALVSRLRADLASALAVDRSVVELSFHACWLHHAVHELRHEAPDGSGPFATIAGTVAREPERFAATLELA